MYNAITAWGTAYHKTGATSAERSLSYESIIAELENLEYEGERLMLMLPIESLQIVCTADLFMNPSIELFTLHKRKMVLI